MSKKKLELAGGVEKVPSRSLKMVSKNIGLLTTKIHVPDGPVRLPDDIREYAAPAYPEGGQLGRQVSRQEAEIRRLSSVGLTPVKIALGTGLRLALIYEVLGLKEDTQFDKDRAELGESRKI